MYEPAAMEVTVTKPSQTAIGVEELVVVPFPSSP
jgi:hypothetical protein